MLREQSGRDQVDVLAYCFMPDHIHLLICVNGEVDMVRFMQALKGKTDEFELAIRAEGQLCAAKFRDHVLRESEDEDEHLRYILANPVRAGFVGMERLPVFWLICLRPCRWFAGGPCVLPRRASGRVKFRWNREVSPLVFDRVSRTICAGSTRGAPLQRCFEDHLRREHTRCSPTTGVSRTICAGSTTYPLRGYPAPLQRDGRWIIPLSKGASLADSWL